MAHEVLAWFLNSAFVHTLAGLATAFVLATLIGAERQWRQRTAGLRTNVLVAVGAAAFADLGTRLLGADGATRIISYIVSGIGFLGAGVILKEGTQIRGLNTAATLWCSAAVGVFAGSSFLGEAVAVSFFVVAGNTLLRPLVNYINRLPIDTHTTEARYRVHVLADQREVSAARDILDETLEKVGYPVLEVETLSDTETQVELAATLVPSSADAVVLDAVVAQLEKSPSVTAPPGLSARRRNPISRIDVSNRSRIANADAHREYPADLGQISSRLRGPLVASLLDRCEILLAARGAFQHPFAYERGDHVLGGNESRLADRPQEPHPRVATQMVAALFQNTQQADIVRVRPIREESPGTAVVRRQVQHEFRVELD
jgi:putative Mg2+ transporter-C (MgtC) family protein